MEDYFIPFRIQCSLEERTNLFITKIFPKASWRISADSRGKFICLRLYMRDGSCQNLGRLTYSGNTENMSFAIYKNNTKRYESKTDFFGSQHLDGTIEGALRAIVDPFS